MLISRLDRLEGGSFSVPVGLGYEPWRTNSEKYQVLVADVGNALAARRRNKNDIVRPDLPRRQVAHLRAPFALEDHVALDGSVHPVPAGRPAARHPCARDRYRRIVRGIRELGDEAALLEPVLLHFMYLLISGVGSERSMKPKVPFSFTSRAASTRPLIAPRHSEVARLMRFTPAACSSATLNDLPLMPAMKLYGFERAAHTLRTASRSGNPGAISTSAPAFSNACSRLIVSSRSSRPRTKFSVRAVRTKSCDRATLAAAATRATACSKSYTLSRVASSIEQPASPTPTARRMVSAAAAGSSAKQFS